MLTTTLQRMSVELTFAYVGAAVFLRDELTDCDSQLV